MNVRHPAERDISYTRSLWTKLLSEASSEPSAEPPSHPSGIKPSTLPRSDHNIKNSMPSALLTSITVQPSASVSHQVVRPSASTYCADPSFKSSTKLNCTPSAQGSTYLRSYSLKMRLPASLDNMQPSIFTMEGPLNLVMAKVDEPAERTILTCLLEELNEKFNASLDTNFMTCRNPSYLAI